VALSTPSSRRTSSVSAGALPRALQILQALVEEANRRGYVFVPQADDQLRFQILVGEDRFSFSVREEQDKADVYPEEQIAAAKYPWQRVSPTLARVPSGRLTIEMVDGYWIRRWADRARWSLADKFPELFALVEDRAQHARNQRDAAAQTAARKRELWEQAVPQARGRYLGALNQRRAIEQATAWRAAGDLRAYAMALRQAADAWGQERKQSILNWAEFAEQHADRIDPLNEVAGLCFVEPEQISSDDLDRHMPAGMSVRHPPGLDTHPRS
jgi:hypothetical protein